MRMTNRDDENALVKLIARMRYLDWSPEAVRGAIRRTVMERGATYSMGEIVMAATHCAMNPLNEGPDSIWREGPHWDSLDEYLNTGSGDEGGKRYASRHDREVLEDARTSEQRRDPAGSARGAEAARQELARLRQVARDKALATLTPTA